MHTSSGERSFVCAAGETLGPPPASTTIMPTKGILAFCALCAFVFLPPTVAQPMTDKQRKKQEDKLRKELQPYQKWVEEEVADIISAEERAALTRLSTDEERQQFIEQFWLRRDPTPDTEENEFREEHYRRMRLRQ